MVGFKWLHEHGLGHVVFVNHFNPKYKVTYTVLKIVTLKQKIIIITYNVFYSRKFHSFSEIGPVILGIQEILLICGTIGIMKTI